MKDYLCISLSSSTFYSERKEEDLWFDCSINMYTGNFGYDIEHDISDIREDYAPNNGDKFYFLPGVTVPRIKLKELNSQYKIKTVRDVDEANIIFMGTKTIDTLFDYKWEFRVETDLFKQFVETAKEKGYFDTYYYSKIETALEFYTNDFIIIPRETFGLLTTPDISFNIKEKLGYLGSSKFNFIKDEYLEVYKSLIGKTVYKEDCLYDYINGADAVTIDQNMYEVLCDMFKSSDTDNHVLAMEIMANSDYKSSILYLCYLLNKFWSVIENRRERTHVNFKSLLIYMGRGTSSVSLDKDDIVNLMISKNLLTKEYYLALCDMFIDEIKAVSSEHFKIKTVSSSTVVDEYLNQEVTYQIKDDYQPEVQTITTQQDEFTNTELNFI